MALETRLVETFNTHLMQDEVVRALATGRDDELADIMGAIRQAAAQPDRQPPALIMYGERGSGKSFLMRLVQLECAAVPGIACVLLPEEQDNIRTPQKILQVVASQVRGEPWTQAAWEFDARGDEDAWAEDLAALHAALDARFGVGQGLVVVLLENLDVLFLRLFGASAPPSDKASAGALARRLAEERLRKLMTAPGSRFMLVASATGTVDMDYERPLFMAFRNIDLQQWDSQTAIRYYNKRRDLENLPALNPAEQARAEAITEFTGGNARLTQLLGTALSTPNIQDIANIFDELVDRLRDYYRQRLDALPPATVGLLDNLIRGGEPVTQSGLAQRVKGTQPQIADAFSYLIRSRLVQAGSPVKPGGGQLFKVRDRLFVHFYRRRNGQASALAAIAELLESVLTPAEREAEIRSRLMAGNYADIDAFGLLPLSPHVRATGFCPFRDNGISHGPDHYAFALAGVASDEVPALRRALCERPREAYRYWQERAQRTAQPLPKAAASILAAKAASRMGLDQVAEHDLAAASDCARASGNADAMIVLLETRSALTWNRLGKREGAKVRTLQICDEITMLVPRAKDPTALAIALTDSGFRAFWNNEHQNYSEFSRRGLKLKPPPFVQLRLLYSLAHAELKLDHIDLALHISSELYQLACHHSSVYYKIVALALRASLSQEQGRDGDAVQDWEAAAILAASIDDRAGQAELLSAAAWTRRILKDSRSARDTAQRALELSLGIDPPEFEQAGQASLLIAQTLLGEAETENASAALPHLLEALRYAGECNAADVAADALDELIFAASETPSILALNSLSEWLVRDKALLLREDLKVKDNWPWAVARANAWPEALALARSHPDFLVHTPNRSWKAAFRHAARPWVDAARQQGRAAAYALASAALPAMRELWILRGAKLDPDEPYAALGHEWVSLISTLTAGCRDPDLLRDLADLFETVLGPVSASQTALLRAFADLHAAPDQEAYLQQADPDLAVMMRRVLKLPEPPDALDRRGRKRSR